jgi:hypothetical protein
MNEEEKQALLLKYKDVLDKFNDIESEDIHNYDEMSFGEWIWSSFYSEDILTRSLSRIYHEFSISSQPYSKFILYFKENNWHKYDSHNPYPIQHNLSSSLNNYELFKLIKHRLNALEKRYTHSFISRRINRFQDDETLTEEEVNNIILKNVKACNNSFVTLKELKIDSPHYTSLKVLMEQIFVLNEEDYSQV